MQQKRKFIKRVARRIFEYFLQGLLYLTPIGITLWIFFSVLRYIDNSIQPAIEQVFHISIPGLGFVLIFMLITLTGIVGQSFFASQLRLFIQHMIQKAPVLKTIYSSVKDFVSAFLGKERKFTKAVRVKINAGLNIEKIGFVTQHDLSILKAGDKVAVYFPYPYSMMGDLLLVPKELITELDIPPAEAMKFIISGGVSSLTPEEEIN